MLLSIGVTVTFSIQNFNEVIKMKSIKRFAKKSLSLILCLAMVMTTVIFFEIGITKPEAAVSQTNSTEHSDVLFYVPETVYLRPHSQSWLKNTTSTFHFFVENDVVNGNDLKTTPTVNQAIPTIGNVYFQYPNAKDGSVQLYYRWLNSSLSSTLNGNGVYIGSTSVGVNQNVVLSKATGANYYHTTITAANSKSPDLAAGDTGCYLEWTVKYHDTLDNLDKTITAYTYVYKPNVVPLSTSGRILNNTGTDSFCQAISWITGVHTVSAATEKQRYAKYSTSSTGTGAFMPFQTSAPLQPINDNGSGAVGVKFPQPTDSTFDSGVMMNSYFASTTTSFAYFKAGQANSTFNNYGVGAYHNDSQKVPAVNADGTVSVTDSTTYNISAHVYETTDNGGGVSIKDHSVYLAINNNGSAGIYIDTSRYSNLNQVPNLGIGLMMTDSENATGGAWYVADYTGKSQSGGNIRSAESRDSYFGTDGWNLWSDRGSFIAHQAEATKTGNFTERANWCELKYAGTFPKAIASTSQGGAYTYKVKMGAATDDDGDGASVTMIMQLQATQYNKANLRNAVANAQKEFALLGISDNSYNSHYYKNEGAYTTFINAYKTASQALLTVNGSITNPDTLATNLNNALSTLKADTKCRKTGKATQYNAGVIRNEDGSLRIVRLPDSQNFEQTYYLRDQVSFSAESYSGCHFLAMYKLESTTNFDALVNEAYDVVKSTTPPSTDGNNRQNIRIKQNTDMTTVFEQLGTVSTSTAIATFASNSQVTYPYAYDTDISYIYFYEIDNGEVLFGNEFDFDAFRWVGTNQSTADIDHVQNTVTLNTTESATDAYTTAYNNTQKGYMTLVPGRTYEFSCSVKNNSSVEVRPNMFFFTFDAAPTSTTSVGLGTSGTDFISASTTVAANGTGTIKGTLRVPAGRPYATLRVGTYTPSVSITYSDIVVRDITVYTTTHQTNNVTMPDPLHKDGAPNASVTDFPVLTRPGYQLSGWSTVREANGNGSAANIVTSTTVPANGNRTLYPVWQTNVIYDLDGGIYRKSSDSSQTSYQVEGRWNLNVGTLVPVSNRITQGQTNWNSADVSYTYVPYKPGYNFKGWKAESVDSSVNGKVYWPTDVVVANANVEFTAVWEQATAVTFNESKNMAQGYVTSSQNNMKFAFYPGQVHFFSYTAPRAQYASAYTSNNRGSDLEMQAFDGSLNFVMENDNHEFDYGISGINDADPVITLNLEGGKTYYAGITMHSITGYTPEGTDFTIQEHTVKYTLLPNGGTINGSTVPQTVIGYSNIDTVLPTNGEKYGYDFAGWLSEETPAKNYEAGKNVPGADNYTRLNGYTESLVKDVYLAAQWSPKPFSIIYDKNIPAGATPTDASPMPATGTLRYATDGVISEIVPSMEGYTFKGWATTAEKAEGEKLYQKGESIPASTATALFDANNGSAVTLYARWAPNLIIVRFKPGAGTGEEFTQNFWYDQEQKIDTQNFDPEKYSVGFYEVGTTEAIETLKADLEFDGWQDVETGTPNYTYANGAIIKNPNGVTGISDTQGVETILYAKWKGGVSTVTTPVWVSTGDTHVLAGWSVNSDASTIDYAVGEAFAPKGDMKLYAVWYPVDTAEDVIVDFKQYDKNESVVTGIEIAADGTYTEIKSMSEYPVYENTAYKAAVQRYENAREALKKNATAENNREYYAAIKDVESYATNPPVTKAPITAYLTQFEIKYAEGVEGKIPAGQYSLTDMNLNHYATTDLDNALEALNEAKAVENMLNQSVVNRSVVTMANAYANPQDVKTSTPVYTVYDTPESMKESGLIAETEGITSVNYVYTGKGNYTYYCYTNSKTPTMLLTVDEDKTQDGRYCYPTTATSGDVVMTNGAASEMPELRTASDNKAANAYSKYLAKNMGTADGRDASYYQKKAVVELNPDFTTAGDKATVTYTITAHDDAYAPTAAEINYADSAKLTSGAEKGNVKDIPNTENAVTPENTITIIIDYHEGEGFDVTGQQAGDDEWLKQYHLARSSGGASNWELPVSGDSVYTVYDNTYGATDYGSFTYTFNVGAENDIAHCVLASADVNDVIATVKDNYEAMKAVAFDGAQEIWKWAYDKNDGNIYKYMCTHAAGTGLGFKTWSNTNWSFNYYPASGAYTYVHLVDRWGNTVDKVIQVPNLDGSAVQLHTNAAGTVEAIEVGGSGIDTMSFSAQSFEIITDDNSTFDGETYTTTGNTVTVYTGEANKKYTLEANDVATNNTKENVTTDANGYLTIVVEDKAYDEGVYTFSLNGTEINLYGEVTAEPEEPTRGVTNVEYTPSTDTRNEFMFTVIGRPDKIQVIEPDGGTRTYDRYHVKVVIVSYDENGNEVSSMSRELSYEVWTIEMNVPAETELTAIARYGRDWSREAPYKYTVLLADPVFDDAVYSMSLESTEGAQGKVAATVVTGLDVAGVRFVMDNSTTATYYKSTEADGRLTYNGYAWINHADENIIVVKIRVNNAWINAGELTYNAI